MSFKIINVLENIHTFNLKELVRSVIGSAVELHIQGGKDYGQPKGDSCVESTGSKQQVSELVLFVLDSMQANPEYIASTDLIRLVEKVGYSAVQQSCLQSHHKSLGEELKQSVYRLFAAVLLAPDDLGYQDFKSKVQQECLEGLRNYIDEQRLLVALTSGENDEGKNTSFSVFSVRDVSEILFYALRTNGPWDTDSEHVRVEEAWLEDCFKCLLDILEFSEAVSCSQVSGMLLPQLLSSSKDKLQNRLSMIWQRLLKVHRTSSDLKSRQTSNVYTTLCGLSEFYIPLASPSIPDQPLGHLSLLSDDIFWRVIQAGLVHCDPLARKQACFLLKRSIESASVNCMKIPDKSTLLSASGIATGEEESTEPGNTTSLVTCLFWWSPDSEEELLTVWQDFFLLYETLDEVQVHVVTPVMPRMSSLIQAASSLQLSGQPVLHPSWLTVLFSRCFVHETKTVSQWGLLEYLHLDIASCPVLQEIAVEFLLSTVLPVLNDDSLYSGKSLVTAARPVIAEAFMQFMQSCIKLLGKRDCGAFLRKFLAALSHQSWSPVSLTFVFDMLANLPEFSAWGPAELQLLREMQFSCISMLSLTYRSIVQCLMLQAVVRFLDKDATSLQKLSGLLGLFNKCLCRGSLLWKHVCEWFKANQHSQLFGSSCDMVASVRSEVSALLTFDPCTSSDPSMALAADGESSRVACLVLLAVDSLYTNTDSGPSLPPGHPSDGVSYLQGILAPLIAVLSSLASHIYLPVIKADTALQLLHRILQNLLHPNTDQESADPVRQELFSVLSSCLEEIYSFVNRRLLSADTAQSSDTARVSLYISVLESTHRFLKTCPRYSLLRNVVTSGQTRLTECCKLLMTQSMENTEKNSLLSRFNTFVACRLLLWLLETNRGPDLHKLPWDALSSLLTFNDNAATHRSIPDASSSTTLRKISNQLVCVKWQCVSILLQRGVQAAPYLLTQPDEVILAACVRDLTLVRGPDAVPIMQCATVLVNKVNQDTTPLCLDLVDAAWSVTLDEWRGKAQKFWLVYSAAVELIFQQCFLVSEVGSQIHDALGKVIRSILSLGEGKPKIVTVFVKHMCSQWASQLDDEERRTSVLKAVSNHMPLLIEICSMGSKVSKDIRLQQDICVYLQQLTYLHAVQNDITACIEQRAGQRRVILVNFLLLLATTRSRACCQLITVFLQELLKKFLELKATTKRSYTMNTLLHRQNIRIWQTLLVLVPYLAMDHADKLLDDVLTTVVREKQSSVRYLMIWTATQLLMLVPCLQERVWQHLQKLRETMETNVCPLLLLIAQLGIVQPDMQQQESFYQRAFPVVVPWALVQTSSIRHLALLSVKKMWHDCLQAGLGRVVDAFPVLQSCMCFLQDGTSAVPSQNKPDSNFFLFKVHPVQDYTMETVFHILPALSSLSEDEFLEPQLFKKDCPSLWSSSNKAGPLIRLYNPEGSLTQEEYCLTLAVHSSTPQSGLGGSLTNSGSAASNKESNVQKKITPWQDTVMPGFDDVISRAGMEDVGSKKGSLVLVASLIDKAPNLGGLCRTSQIFGVSTLVVNSLRVTSDKIFQTLSVTAEKWLPIIEVPVTDLASYLHAMKHKGYTLVGVEQTARSKCLTKYQFPEKTLLLLGHERTGIPVELIQLLDVCVEIPQQGIIRSLNVHVSGALLVWEYTRQRLLAQASE